MALHDLLNHEDPVFHGIPLDQMRPEDTDAYFWLCYQDDQRDQGIPEDEILSYQDWKAARIDGE